MDTHNFLYTQKKIRQKLKQLNRRQKQLAASIGISGPFLSEMMNGKKKIDRYLFDISDYLGLSICDLTRQHNPTILKIIKKLETIPEKDQKYWLKKISASIPS